MSCLRTSSSSRLSALCTEHSCQSDGNLKSQGSMSPPDHKFSVAPMMDWTDRHCRFLHRQLTARALLYTEMVTAQAIIHGQRERLLGFDRREDPVALQLGGGEPAQ